MYSKQLHIRERKETLNKVISKIISFLNDAARERIIIARGLKQRL